MSTSARLFIAAALLCLTFVLFRQAQGTYQAQPDDYDGTKVVMLFGAVVLVGAAGGVLLVLTVLPYLGDAIGNVFFHPNEQVEKNPHAKALAAMACGEYERAAEEYEKCFSSNPEDTLALSEVVRLYCEKLDRPEPAAAMIEEALQRDLLPEDAAFLCSRLADVYWTYQNDITRARALLMQVIETMPNTRHAANATHRLQEIERQVVMQEEEGGIEN